MIKKFIISIINISLFITFMSSTSMFDVVDVESSITFKGLRPDHHNPPNVYEILEHLQQYHYDAIKLIHDYGTPFDKDLLEQGFKLPNNLDLPIHSVTLAFGGQHVAYATKNDSRITFNKNNLDRFKNPNTIYHIIAHELGHIQGYQVPKVYDSYIYLKGKKVSSFEFNELLATNYAAALITVIGLNTPEFVAGNKTLWPRFNQYPQKGQLEEQHYNLAHSDKFYPLENEFKYESYDYYRMATLFDGFKQ